MYSATAATCDRLTLNAPYPDCHANDFVFQCSWIHRLDPDLISCTAFAIECVGRSEINPCTWSETPLNKIGYPSMSRVIPARYAFNCSCISGLIFGSRFLVLNTTCTSRSEWVWDTRPPALTGRANSTRTKPRAGALG